MPCLWRSGAVDFTSKSLKVSVDSVEAYVYPGSTLHCTVCAFRAFTLGALLDEEKAVERWLAVLQRARASEKWPKGSFRLLMGRPTLEGSAGIFRYDDLAGNSLRLFFEE